MLFFPLIYIARKNSLYIAANRLCSVREADAIPVAVDLNFWLSALYCHSISDMMAFKRAATNDAV